MATLGAPNFWVTATQSATVYTDGSLKLMVLPASAPRGNGEKHYRRKRRPW